VRTVQRVVEDERRAQVAADVATIRFETPPGKQMQIDFGQKRVMIGRVLVTVHLLVAVLSYSRRIFVRAFLTERGDGWREGIADAFRHFGGVVHVVLGDNAKALVVKHDREMRISHDREHRDRSIVNGGIAVVNGEIAVVNAEIAPS
jgi:transposase